MTEFTGNGNQRDGVNQWELTVPLECFYLMLIRYHDIMFYFLSFTMVFFLVFITLTAKIVDTHAFQWSVYILF